MTSDPLERFVKSDPSTRMSDRLVHEVKKRFDDFRGDIIHQALISFGKVSLTNMFAYMALHMRQTQEHETIFKFVSMYREIYGVASGLEKGSGEFCYVTTFAKLLASVPVLRPNIKAQTVIDQYMHDVDKIYPNRHVLRTIPDHVVKVLEAKGYVLMSYGRVLTKNEAPLDGLSGVIFSYSEEECSKMLQLQFYKAGAEYPLIVVDFNYHPLMEEVIHSSIMKAGKPK